MPALHTAALTTASHQTIGTIFLYNGRPGWLYMNVDIGSGNGTIICQLEGRDGSITTIGSFRLTGGYGSWGSPEPLPPHAPPAPGTGLGLGVYPVPGRHLHGAGSVTPPHHHHHYHHPPDRH